MSDYFALFMLLLIVAVPLISAITTLAYLFCVVYDRITIRKKERQGQDASALRSALKKHRRGLLISFVICACSWILLLVLSNMMLANM